MGRFIAPGTHRPWSRLARRIREWESLCRGTPTRSTRSASGRQERARCKWNRLNRGAEEVGHLLERAGGPSQRTPPSRNEEKSGEVQLTQATEGEAILAFA